MAKDKDSIMLHPEKGLNPHMTLCRTCGKEVGIALLGETDSLFLCESCGKMVADKRSKRTCPRCKGRLIYKKPIDDFDKFPWEECDECRTAREAEQAEHAKVVAEGGVYFRCKDCKVTGVIRPNDFTQQVRAQANIAPPNPVGVEFTKDDCPQCSAGANDLPGKPE